MIDAHRTALSARHAQLETKIASESQRPAPDALLITELKREKLRLKDEIAQLTRH